MTVTDEQGHQAIASVELAEPEKIKANADISDLSVIGGNDGSITVTPTGGTPGYTFLWPQTMDTTRTLSNLPFGPRWIDITDANGCVQGDTFFINNPFCNLMVNVQTTDVSCFGESDGEAIVDVSGGTPPFSFNYSSDISGGLSAGSYSVTILDAINCGLIEDFEINEPAEIKVDPIITTTCTGRVAQLNVSGGVPPYEFLWKGGSTDSTNNILDTLEVDIIDANGCMVEVFEALTTFQFLNVALDSISLNDATIFVTPSGGTPPFAYNWEDSNGNNISTSEDLTDVTDGIYFLEVEDANGCLVSIEVEVSGISSTANLQSFDSVGKVFPNPTANLLTVEINSNASAEVGVSIFDSSNRLVLKEAPAVLNNNQKVLSIGHLAKGLYFMKIQIEDSFYFQKVILE